MPWASWGVWPWPRRPWPLSDWTGRPDQGAVAEVGILQSFHTTLTNTGDELDTFTVSMVKVIPEDWIGSICVGETCYPPFVTSVEVILGAGDTEFLDIDITPNVVTGSGSCRHRDKCRQPQHSPRPDLLRGFHRAGLAAGHR